MNDIRSWPWILSSSSSLCHKLWRICRPPSLGRCCEDSIVGFLFFFVAGYFLLLLHFSVMPLLFFLVSCGANSTWFWSVCFACGFEGRLDSKIEEGHRDVEFVMLLRVSVAVFLFYFGVDVMGSRLNCGCKWARGFRSPRPSAMLWNPVLDFDSSLRLWLRVERHLHLVWGFRVEDYVAHRCILKVT